MKSLLLLISLSLVTATKLAATETLDDFSKDSGLWKWSKGGGKGTHAVQNGRLEYSTNGGQSTNDSATHYLKSPVGRYDESWEVQADVYLGSFVLGGQNPYAGLALLVGNTSRPTRDFIRLQLRKGGDERRAFNADAHQGTKNLGSEWIDSTSTMATLKISFNGNTKILTASYDSDGAGIASSFAAIYTIKIGSGPEGWKMRDADIFEFSLVSQTTGTVVAFGGMYFDNVVIRNLGR